MPRTDTETGIVRLVNEIGYVDATGAGLDDAGGGEIISGGGSEGRGGAGDADVVKAEVN